MMQFTFYDFLHHTGMTPTDQNAIAEYEIMLRIGRMLPASTPPTVLRRLWRDAFSHADPTERRLTHRVHRGAFK